MVFQEILLTHFEQYPAMTPRDAVKLCYQSAFGPGHMIKNEQTAQEYLKNEYAQTEKSAGVLFEKIGGGLVRAHLSAWPEDVPVETLGRAFVLSAEKWLKNPGDLGARLAALETLAQQGRTPFSKEALAAYLSDYRAAGCPAVHHSESFGAAYRPAYRVVDAAFAQYFSLICDIARAKKPLCAAIDGRCGSGKTTLAAYLSELFACPVVRMDDFFLPFVRKTPERLAMPGGNCDHERFAQEVLPHLGSGKAFSYFRYDCSRGALCESPIEIAQNDLLILEGSYCLYPPTHRKADIRVFLSVDKETQRMRLKARDPFLLSRFENEWIPMEEAYFAHFGIQEICTHVFAQED